MALVFFTGGGSRDDVQSLAILRPLAVLFAAYAITNKANDCWKGRLFPLYIALALSVIMTLQLIPLPPSVWIELPGRRMFADIANLAGIEQPWRPLTLSPSRTLNSLFSLSVPIAAMMLYLNIDNTRRKGAIAVIIILAATSAAWAAFQIAGPPRGSLYLYTVTNDGLAVGLFANRNHQAVLLAATIAMLGWYAGSNAPVIRLATLKFYGSISTIFVLVPLIFITGSRTGLILMAPAIAAAMIFIYFGRYSTEALSSAPKVQGKQKWFLSSRQLMLLGSLATVATIAALAIYFSRSLAIDRLFGGNELGALRVQLIPTLIKMIGDYFPWGSGFGSFEYVYRIYEPQDLLAPRYLNQAHNDWLQFPIEGGIAAMIIAAAAVIWFFLKLFRIVKSWSASRYTKYTALMAAFVMACFITGSVGDYPLRVPSIIAVFGVMSCILNDAATSVQRKKRMPTQ